MNLTNEMSEPDHDEIIDVSNEYVPPKKSKKQKLSKDDARIEEALQLLKKNSRRTDKNIR